MTNYPTIKTSIILCIGLFLMLASTLAATAEYINPAISDKDSAAYWMDQGGLFSTYGNFKAAANAYAKALEQAPSSSEILFDLGVTYAQMDDHQKALANIDKAIMLSPDNGRFHYGRAWVLMLSGQSDKAYPEFQKAAELGNIDAQAYLQGGSEQ